MLPWAGETEGKGKGGGGGGREGGRGKEQNAGALRETASIAEPQARNLAAADSPSPVSRHTTRNVATRGRRAVES